MRGCAARACGWERGCGRCSLQRFSIIPVAAVALALTFRGGDSKPPIAVSAQSGSYDAQRRHAAQRDRLRDRQHSKSTVTVTRVRVSQDRSRARASSARSPTAVRSDCVADSAVPPKVTPPRPTRRLRRCSRVKNIALKPREQLTLLLSVARRRARAACTFPAPHRRPHGLRSCASSRRCRAPRCAPARTAEQSYSPRSLL